MADHAWFYDRSRWYGSDAVIARFHAKLQPEPRTGCWLWTAGVDKDGYGKFMIMLLPERKQVHVRAPIFAFALHAGRYPTACVLHSCSVSGCCNPEHLFEGTRAQAIALKVAKGRQARGDRNGARLYPERMPRGERHGMATIDEGTALRVATLARNGVRSAAAISRRLGISYAVVDQILRGVTWRHVTKAAGLRADAPARAAEEALHA